MLPTEGDGVPPGWSSSCAAAIALGTMAAGGKRIIKTMGTKIIRISPLQGFAAETAARSPSSAASHLGIPVSTTHVINACIMGVGASKRALGRALGRGGQHPDGVGAHAACQRGDRLGAPPRLNGRVRPLTVLAQPAAPGCVARCTVRRVRDIILAWGLLLLVTRVPSLPRAAPEIPRKPGVGVLAGCLLGSPHDSGHDSGHPCGTGCRA
jgi:phosphate/sulfate permease